MPHTLKGSTILMLAAVALAGAPALAQSAARQDPALSYDVVWLGVDVFCVALGVVLLVATAGLLANRYFGRRR